MTGPYYNVNDRRNFFSDEHFNSIGEDAEYADWMPGPNEDINTVPERSRERPIGDYSSLPFMAVESEQYDVNKKREI